MTWKHHISVTLLTSLLVGSVSARQDGADPYACDNMTPLHGSRQRDDRAPYYIHISNTTYTPGVPITVTLSSDSGESFKGFLIQARVSEMGPHFDKPVGYFTPVARTKTICSRNVGLTHTNPEPKSSLTFEWIPPDSLFGKIQFRTTFVQSYYSYWVAQLSDILNEGQTTTSSTVKPTTFTTTTQTTVTSQSTSSKSTSAAARIESMTSTTPLPSASGAPPTSNSTQPTVGDGGGGNSMTSSGVFIFASLFVYFAVR